MSISMLQQINTAERWAYLCSNKLTKLKKKEKNCVCLRSHGRSENYETSWGTDFKTFLLKKPSRTFLSHCSLSFGIIFFNFLVFHFLGRVILHRRIQLLRFSALLFRIFLHTRTSQFPLYFQFVIDLIFSSIFCNRI